MHFPPQKPKAKAHQKEEGNSIKTQKKNHPQHTEKWEARNWDCFALWWPHWPWQQWQQWRMMRRSVQTRWRTLWLAFHLWVERPRNQRPSAVKTPRNWRPTNQSACVFSSKKALTLPWGFLSIPLWLSRCPQLVTLMAKSLIAQVNNVSSNILPTLSYES